VGPAYPVSTPLYRIGPWGLTMVPVRPSPCADNLELEAIAEGVETAEHAAMLGHLQCHCLQGYAIARPMAPEAIPD